MEPRALAECIGMRVPGAIRACQTISWRSCAMNAEPMTAAAEAIPIANEIVAALLVALAPLVRIIGRARHGVSAAAMMRRA